MAQKIDIRLILLTWLVAGLAGCNLISSSAPHPMTIAISGGVYGELEPCG